ncbi:hypothetical protein ACG02S_07805 [Roseateles sp. DC23W]|uniref:Uncharacterized protein n=1 Tax=Pelomonas dachongensis TaxID=3299029 RepID=A0ABW7EK11_9BURK
MPTFAKQLLDAAETALASQLAIPASSTYFERVAPISDDECPALNVAVGEARKIGVVGSEGEYDLIELEVDMSFSVHTRGEARTRVADPFVDAVNGALMRDPSLGGLAQRLGLFSLRPRQAPAGTTVGIADVLYRARCLVRERDLSIFTH